MSRRAGYLIAAIAAIGMVAGCSSGSSASNVPGTGNQTQAAATRQTAATSEATAATQQSAALAPQACAVLTKDQVGTEFGATFPEGTVSNTVPPVGSTGGSTCKFHVNSDGTHPWTITVYVFGFASDAAASAQMTQYKHTTLTTGATNWAIVQLSGPGDDAIYHNLISLRDTQEEVIVRKGSTIYWLLDTMVTGISDVAAARAHLVALATLAISH
jgi:hypothetical protein